MDKVSGVVIVNGLEHRYTIIDKSKKVVEFECSAARIKQDFLKVDIANLKSNLHNLILANEPIIRKDR